MEKKRTRRATDGDGGDGRDGGGVSAEEELPHDLVVEEVLTRLPGKSLMRFKSVSKLWCSIIDDTRFCQAHRAHSRSCPTLLLFTMCSGLGGVTDVVNGLFCLYRGNRVWICSISADQGSECEILTLGKDESWRTIHDPSIDIWKQRVYIHEDGDENEESQYISSPRGWIRRDEDSLHQFRGHVALIPCAFVHGRCNLLGNLPTGEMLMTGTSEEEEEEEEEEINSNPIVPPLYSYDPAKGMFAKHVNNLPSSLASIRKDTKKFRIYYYEENITPLKHLLGVDESSGRKTSA
ncbi:F-box and associated interaction domains-containing protein [Actinidia rufa]|uniref:F-box and associated interaction domains-containing protein n=1 Tax=Actinidia rufa TaxID=165716 RepID=A0A7J0GN14_9ERIC|nr:F-box and associated interaction domains-containing protein [Actinidia rufa]